MFPTGFQLTIALTEKPPTPEVFAFWWMIPLGYIVGATPFGFMAGKMRGIDIRDHGSGNIGATNVLRVLGKPVGITTLILDILKGLAPVWVARILAGPENSLIPILTAIAAILGHNYTFWLKFKGGKGIATSAGAIAPVIPIPLLAAIFLWILSFAITRYVSIASIVSALTLPVVVIIQAITGDRWDIPLLIFSLFLFGMATWRHRSNIRRLIDGTENRFEPKSRRKKSADSSDVADP